jgi:hypothetical protein
MGRKRIKILEIYLEKPELRLILNNERGQRSNVKVFSPIS